MNNWPIFEGETEEHYVYRICSMKDQIGTWPDVANVINETLGQNKGECAYRKTWKAFQDMQDACGYDTTDSQAVLEEIKNERRELEKAKVKFRDERNEVSRLMRVQARGESMRELIERCIDAYDPAEYEHVDVMQCVGAGRL